MFITCSNFKLLHNIASVGSLLSLRKSNLLSYVDELAPTPGEEDKDENIDTMKSTQAQTSMFDMDEEFAAFQVCPFQHFTKLIKKNDMNKYAKFNQCME